ncbi:transcriptional regulator [Enterobacter hormaechei]
MIFVIDERVRFNTADASLVALDGRAGPIVLNKFCAELLELLIAHQGQPVSRELVFQILWEQKGMTATNSGLNNYISMLRKGLAECGCENMIETLPRYGFVFTASAEMQAVPQPMTGENKPESTPKMTDESWRQLVVKAWGKAWGIALLAGMAVVLAFVLGYVSREQHSPRTELFREGNCRYYVADDKTSIADHDALRKKIREIIQREKIVCDSKTNVYYFSDRMLDSRGNVISDELLSVCPYNSKAPCINYSFLKSERTDER